MTLHGQPVFAEHLYTSIENICKWLQKHTNVYLIAHNGRRFDFPVLMSALMNIKYYAQFSGMCLGIYWQHLCAQSSYKQEDLARALLHIAYEAHNAMDDVKTLGKLVSHTKMDAKELTTHSLPPTAVQNQLRFNIIKAKKLTSLHSLVGKVF